MALEAIKFTGRTRLIIMSDQENAVKNLVDLIRDSRTNETAVINTPKGSSASAGEIERANYDGLFREGEGASTIAGDCGQ